MISTLARPSAWARDRMDVALRAGIGYADDVAGGKVPRHPQRQGAPAAAQFQHALPVAQLRPFRGHRQGARFCVRQVQGAFGPPGAAVFAMRSEHMLEEVGRHLVVLFIREPGQRGDVGDAHRLHKPFADQARALGVVSRDLRQSLRAQPANAGPDQRIRERGLVQSGRWSRRSAGQRRVPSVCVSCRIAMWPAICVGAVCVRHWARPVPGHRFVTKRYRCRRVRRRCRNRPVFGMPHELENTDCGSKSAPVKVRQSGTKP